MPYTPPLNEILYVVTNLNGAPRSRDTSIDRTLVGAILGAAAEFAREIAAPAGILADMQGCVFSNGSVSLPVALKEAYSKYAADGWTALVFPQDLGGQDLPGTLQVAVAEMLNGACVPLAMLALTTRGAALTMIAHASDYLKSQFLKLLINGEVTATICVTEPNAGSDVGRISTRANPLDNGHYALTGTKIFISFGEHDATEQIVHMTLARIAGATSGPQGLSLFIVPKFLPSDGARNSISAIGIEHKLGLHGSPTCVMSLDGAIGYLVGEPGRGLQTIFTMINCMRLEVAVQGIAVAGAAYDAAARYANERRQGGRPGLPAAVIGEHPDVRRMLMSMRALVDGSRALVYEAAYQVDRMQSGTSDDQAEAAQLTAWLLPICKAWCSEMAIEVTSLAIQIHGGHGYITETGVERYMRDARIMPIYEGTNGIQAIDLLIRKLGDNPRRVYEIFSRKVKQTISDTDGKKSLCDIRAATAKGIGLLDDTARNLSRRLSEEQRDALAGATPFMNLAAKVAVAWCWLKLAAIQADDKTRVHDHVALAHYYALWLMADIEALAAQAQMGSDAVFGVPLERMIIE